MKKTILINALTLLLCSGVVANSLDFRVSEGINESQRLIETAYKAGGKDKSIYHFEKARAYRDISVLLASEMEELGSKIFAIKSMNSASKAIEGSQVLDKLESAKLGQGRQVIDPNSLLLALEKIRDDKAFNCAPKELAYAEAYYEAIVYELSKDKPKDSLLQTLYNSYLSSYLMAKEKVDISKKESLECYVGKIQLPSVPEAKEEPLANIPEGVAEKVEKVEEPLLVRARVHFDFDKANIKREYIPLLNEVVRTLKENPKISIRIEGYTDNIGGKTYNEKLALRRAMAVKDYLVKHGIDSKRIEVAGFGKEKYIAENTTPIGRLTNRRTEFIVIQVGGD
ncbi:OmpA family protein [Thermocrinis sp.]|uniref:OmpA family protein n=1 Tax=Thermocrinis sp. TaxID=2024383 RepID=UPI002FDD54B2